VDTKIKNGGEKMRTKRLTVLSTLFTIFIIGFASASSYSAVLAKNVNVPDGQKIFYWSGGNTTINVPTSFHWPTAQIGILAFDNDGGSVGTGDSLLLTLTLPVSGVPTTFAWAFITDNAAGADEQRLVFSGTPVYIHKTDSGGVMKTLNNIFQIADDELKVDRHGNSIAVDFTPLSTTTIALNFPNTPYWPEIYNITIASPPSIMHVPPVLYPLVLPAFHLEIEKYGCSTHFASSKTFATTIPSIVLSGYTLSSEQIGFHADATFTCPSWPTPVNMQTSADAFVIMHGINTLIPP
jgi:hypothetical protein